MIIDDQKILEINKSRLANHLDDLERLKNHLDGKGINADSIIKKLAAFQVAIPSWALGTGGTRFGRFSGGGEPVSLDHKIEDIGLLHALNACSGGVSLHIPWDIPSDPDHTKQLAKSFGLKFDAVNSNTFQDHEGDKYSYKFGSLSHVNKDVRDQAIAHNKEVIDYGIALGSDSLTVWLSDGTTFPGQANFRQAYQHTLASLKEIYDQLPEEWKVFIEYKPFEPNFYSMSIPDWGTSYMMANQLGEKASCLVDLGHHLPNTNIEQIVAILMMQNKLGGFHFNDNKYADDDLTVGCVKPYQLFLIFNELVDGMNNTNNPNLSWMIDASHNLKDPMEDLLQSVDAIMMAYAQALIIDRKILIEAQQNNDVSLAQEVLQGAFRTDIRPMTAEARRIKQGALQPISAYRYLKVRKELIKERGKKTISTGL